MAAELVPHQNLFDEPQLGVVDRVKMRGERRRVDLEVATTALNAYVTEVKAQLQHQHQISEQNRVAERAVVGIGLSSDVYRLLVSRCDGDEALAGFLAPVAVRARDAIQRLV